MRSLADPVSEPGTFLRSIPLFSSLSEASLLALARAGKFMQVEKGQFVFFQSDPSEKVYIVRLGLISIVLESPDGR
jgi:CRP-like cAMP-binding protein